jgi:hypothetical protein
VTKICVMCQNRRDKPPQLRTCRVCGVESCDHRRCACHAPEVRRPQLLKSGKDLPVRPILVTCPCGSRLDAITAHGNTQVHAERTCAGCGAKWKLHLTLVGFVGPDGLATYEVSSAEPVG